MNPERKGDQFDSFKSVRPRQCPPPPPSPPGTTALTETLQVSRGAVVVSGWGGGLNAPRWNISAGFVSMHAVLIIYPTRARTHARCADPGVTAVRSHTQTKGPRLEKS